MPPILLVTFCESLTKNPSKTAFLKFTHPSAQIVTPYVTVTGNIRAGDKSGSEIRMYIYAMKKANTNINI